MTEPYRLQVRINSDFYDWLDIQAPLERTEHGEPSGHDFLTSPALEDIRETFATKYESLIQIADDYRVLVVRNYYWPLIKIYGRKIDATIWLDRISITKQSD